MRIAGVATPRARVILVGVLCATLGGIYAISALPSGIYPEAEFPRIAVIAQVRDTLNAGNQMASVGRQPW